MQIYREKLMRRFVVFSAACAALWCGGSTADAQSVPIDFGSGNYYGGATPFGAAAHGFGDLVRSAGMYNYLSSEGVKSLEQARRQYIENRVRWAEAWVDIRNTNREYHRARYLELNPPHTQEDFIRWAQADAPKRLSATRLDPITGYITWPRLLLLDAFADLRRDLEKLYAQRAAAQGAINNDVHYQTLGKIEEMTARLIKLVKTADPKDYTEARNFLQSLARELSFPTG
jgi:hypothetical protein